MLLNHLQGMEEEECKFTEIAHDIHRRFLLPRNSSDLSGLFQFNPFESSLNLTKAHSYQLIEAWRNHYSPISRSNYAEEA
jgi:hypothetical protein